MDPSPNQAGTSNLTQAQHTFQAAIISPVLMVISCLMSEEKACQASQAIACRASFVVRAGVNAGGGMDHVQVQVLHSLQVAGARPLFGADALTDGFTVCPTAVIHRLSLTCTTMSSSCHLPLRKIS